MKQKKCSILKTSFFWYSFVLFVFSFCVGLLMPLGGDDWNNLLNGNCSLNCIIKIAQNAYMSFEGRFFSRICDSLFVPHQIIWSLVSAGMITFIFYAIVKIIDLKDNKLLLPLLTLTLLLVDHETFAQVYVWKTGNITYFFPLFFLFVILFYRRSIFKEEETKDKWYMFFLLPTLTFFFSMFVENMSVAIIVSCILIIIYNFIKNKKVDWLILVCLLMGIIGLYLMLNSPGTKLRALDESQIFADLSLIGKVIYNYPNLIDYTFIKNSFLLIMIVISLTAIILKTSYKKWIKLVLLSFVIIVPMMTSITNGATYLFNHDLRIIHRLLEPSHWYILLYWSLFIILFLFLIFKYKKNKKIIFFVVLALIGNGSMMFSPVWGGRTAYFTTLMLSIVCLLIITNEEKLSENKKIINFCKGITFSFICLFMCYCIYYRFEVNNRENYIQWQVKNGKDPIEVIILPSYHIWNPNPWGDGHHAKMFKIAHNIDNNIVMVKKNEIQNKNYK